MTDASGLDESAAELQVARMEARGLCKHAVLAFFMTGLFDCFDHIHPLAWTFAVQAEFELRGREGSYEFLSAMRAAGGLPPLPPE